MPADTTKYAPVGVYLMVNDGNAALDFYKRAFAAEVTETYPWEGKLGHATLRINGGEVMLSDEFPEAMTGVRSPRSLGGTTCTVTLSVDDADTWFERARTAGAEVVRALNDEFYGRSGKLRDPFGHTWGILGPVKEKKN
ncbi:MAG TPA: VOC family protein [Bryobacteraceae bacterium]|nr:VOC family protein [Bryobacteraceae bacterium]